MSNGQNIPGIPPEMFKGMNSNNFNQQNPKPSQGCPPPQDIPPQGGQPQGGQPQGGAPIAIESDLAMYLVVGVLAWKGWKMYITNENDEFCDNKSICEKIDDCDLDFSH